MTPSDDIRDIATPTYVFFPNTVFVAQPGLRKPRDRLSGRASTRSTGSTISSSRSEPTTDKARAHWELNYELIQNGVFKGEDLWVCEQIQRGLGTSANDRFTYGVEETPIEWFHDELDRRIAEMA